MLPWLSMVKSSMPTTPRIAIARCLEHRSEGGSPAAATIQAHLDNDFSVLSCPTAGRRLMHRQRRLNRLVLNGGAAPLGKGGS